MAYTSRVYPTMKGTNIPDELSLNGMVTFAAADSVPTRAQGFGYTVAKIGTGEIEVTTEWTWDKLIVADGTMMTAAGAAQVLQYKLGSANSGTRKFRFLVYNPHTGALAHPAAGDGFTFTAKLQANRGPSV